MAGRPRKPVSLRLLAGQGKKVRHQQRAAGERPAPPVGRPPRPKYLTGAARRLWEELAPRLVELRVLTIVDRGALELVCTAYADWCAAVELLERDGLTYTTTNEAGQTMVRRHPAVEIRNEAWKRYRAALSDFGLTPASRERIGVAPAPAAPDPVSEWLERHGGPKEC